MITKKVNVTDTETSLTTLLTTAGVVFLNGNDTCTGVMIQLDPAVTGATVEVLDGTALSGDGITLTNDDDRQPSFIATKVDKTSRIRLVATTNPTAVKVLVEQAP